MEAINMTAMREALTKVSEWMAHRIATGGFEASPTFPTVLEDIVLPALAAPPRNCDVYATAEEARQAWLDDAENWDEFGSPKLELHKWLFAPATEKGATDGSK